MYHPNTKVHYLHYLFIMNVSFKKAFTNIFTLLPSKDEAHNYCSLMIKMIQSCNKHYGDSVLFYSQNHGEFIMNIQY